MLCAQLKRKAQAVGSVDSTTWLLLETLSKANRDYTEEEEADRR